LFRIEFPKQGLILLIRDCHPAWSRNTRESERAYAAGQHREVAPVARFDDSDSLVAATGSSGLTASVRADQAVQPVLTSLERHEAEHFGHITTSSRVTR
jgi:hypothetical protein